MEKTIKYLENGEYHYATVRSVGDLAQLKTNSKETLVEAINELWNGGGNADLSKAPKPEGYDQLVQDVADAVKNQQEISQQWIEWQNEEAQLTEERKQAYLQAMKEMQEAIDKAKADAAALDDKTTKLDEQITKTFSDLDTSIQNMHEQLQKEADRMNQELIDTKSDLTKVRTDLQNAQLDNGRIHDELTNINGKFEHKVWQTDLDPLKEQIDRAETSVQQTKDELLGKASRQDLDTVTNTVSKLDTQLKETAKGVEISVKKDELGGEIAEALTNKTNILLGTRRFTTNNWQQREHVEMCSDPWKGFLVAKQNSPIEGIQQAYDVKAGTTYTFSLFAKMDTLDDSNKPQIILAKTNLDTSLDTKIDAWRKEIEDITSDFKRYDLTFTPSEDCTIYPHVISNSNNPIFVCGYQLEIGKTSTPWEPNQEDVGDYVEKSEAQFNVYNDKIQALTEKQRQQGDTQEKLRTEVTQTAEGTKQVSENLKKTNDDITKLRGEFEVKADHMKSEYETYTNKAVGQISDSTLNLIRNSSFQNKDEDFAQWQNVSAKVNVRQDENGLRWVELTQSGMTTDNPQGLTSNYFNVKQGKVTIAVDIKSGDKATLDNESVLTLELYDENKKRVDFTRLTLNDLGLNKSLLGDHQVHRGLYRLGIDRNDAKYMTVKALLTRNGDLYFTNFSARLSSIDDGAYEPNPDDLNQQILKQNTKIEQNSKEVAIKANSVDVTRDIKSAVDNVQVGGVNLVENGDANASNAFPWPNTLCQNHDFYFNGTKKMFNLHTSSTNELTSGCANWFSIEAGQQYTLSFKGFMSWNVSSYDVWLLGRKVGTNGSWTNSFPIIGGQRLSNAHCETITKTFTAPSDWNNFEAYLRFDNNGSSDGNDSVFFFNEVKLEKGNKATSYSPAPGDTSKEIKSAKDAAIQVASDQINIHVNELTTSFDDKLNKRINEQKTASEKFTSDGIEQVVTKVTNVKNDVDRLGDTVKSTGSRNLLHNTSDRYKTLTGNDYLAQSTASDIYTSTANYHNGDWFTYAATITNNSSKNVTLETWLFDQNKRGLDPNSIAPIPLATHSADVYPGEKDKRVSTSFQISGATWFIRTYVIFDGGGAPNGSQVQVKDERLVEGRLSGDWAPNPSDVNKKIENVQAGGVNLLHHSDTFEGWYMGPSVFTVAGKYLNGTVAVLKPNGSGGNALGTVVDPVPGNQLVSWTVYARADNNGDKLHTELWGGGGSTDQSLTTEWKKYKFTGTPNANHHDFYFWGVQGNKGNINVALPMMVLGSNGANWAPNNEDTQQKINEVKTEVTASVKNLGDRVTTEVNSVTTKIKQNNGGGVNLLKRSSFRNTTLEELKKSWSITQYAWVNNKRSIVIDFKNGNGPVADITQDVEIEPNTDYVLSLHLIYAQMSPGKSFGFQTYLVEKDANGNAVSPYKDNGQMMANSDLRSANTRIIHTSNTTHKGTLYLRALPGTQVEFNDVKLERGNIATPWSDSPEDLAEFIGETNTKWDVANGQITGKVTETDVRNILNNGGYATQSWAQSQFRMKSDSIDLEVKKITDPISKKIEEDSKSLSDRIQNLKAGSRNLLHGTSKEYRTITGNGWMSITTANEPNRYISTATKHAGDWYMYTAMINNTSDIPVRIQMWKCRQDKQRIGLLSQSPLVQPGSKDVTVSCGGKIDGETYFIEYEIISSNGQSGNHTIQVAKEHIVEGNLIVDWTPNPDDFGDGVNLVRNSGNFTDLSYWDSSSISLVKHGFWKNGQENLIQISNNSSDEKTMGSNRFNVKRNTNYTLSFWGFHDSNMSSYDVYFLGRKYGSNNNYDAIVQPIVGWKLSPAKAMYVSVTFNSGDTDEGYIRFDNNGCIDPSKASGLFLTNIKVEEGNIATGWTPAPEDLPTNYDIISRINMSPENITIASKKIVIDGNTDIHGDLRTDRVRLVGKQGLIDMTGDDGMRMANKNGSSILIGNGNIDLMYNNDFRMNIDSSMMTLLKKESSLGQNNPIAIGSIGTSFYANDKRRGMQILYTPGKDDWSYRGADYLGIGYSLENQGAQGQRKIYDQLELYRQDTTINGHLKRKGIHVQDALHLSNGLQIYLENKDNDIQDPIKLIGSKYDASSQPEYNQPYLTLGYSNNTGNAGLGINWWELIPTGRINSSYSYMSAHGTDGEDGLTVSWYSWPGWYGGRKAPSIVYKGKDGSLKNGGFVFYPGGEVCFWQGDFRSNFRWSGIKQTD
ncbi:phage specificity protein [Limosilactobacillus reuteri]|uniref:phage specificity protein n=1 Tax=Limosilactobacillus reuteri TaxID=1598 RepID=UPI001EFDE2CA|nr:phage specificity protein [Limosilactobacillus reuteri]